MPISRAGLGGHFTSQWELLIYRLSPDRWCVGAALRELHMPKGTRIAALFRDRQLLHPRGSTRLAAGDVLCVIGHDYDLSELGKLFSVAPQRTSDLRIFGDFILRGDVTLNELAPLYALNLEATDGQLSLGTFVASRIGGKPVVGDYFEWSGLVWAVVELEGNQVLKVGVKPVARKSETPK